MGMEVEETEVQETKRRFGQAKGEDSDDVICNLLLNKRRQSPEPAGRIYAEGSGK